MPPSNNVAGSAAEPDIVKRLFAAVREASVERHTAVLAFLFGCAATTLIAHGPVPDAPAIALPAAPAVTPQHKLNLTVEQRYSSERTSRM